VNRLLLDRLAGVLVSALPDDFGRDFIKLDLKDLLVCGLLDGKPGVRKNRCIGLVFLSTGIGSQKMTLSISVESSRGDRGLSYSVGDLSVLSANTGEEASLTGVWISLESLVDPSTLRSVLLALVLSSYIGVE